jgi:hypothetical protein
MMVSIVNYSVPIMWNTFAPLCYAFHILVTHRRYVYRQNRLKYNSTDPNLTCTIYRSSLLFVSGEKEQFNCNFLCLFNHRLLSKKIQKLKADKRSCAHGRRKSLGTHFYCWIEKKTSNKITFLCLGSFVSYSSGINT